MAIDSSSFPLIGRLGNLFRQIWRTNPQATYLSRNYVLNKNTPVYVDMENLLGVYLMCPQLRMVIDRFAEMFANADVYVCDKNGERVKNHPIEVLLRNPNAMQTQEQYMKMYAIQKNIYNQTFQYKLKPTVRFSELPKAIWCLPPQRMKVVATGKIWDQTKMSGIIEKYVMLNYDLKLETEFKTDSIIHSSDGFSDMYIVGRSKIVTLEKPISNIIGALQTLNCITYDRGALGILSNTAKDSAGGIPLGTDERKLIERQMRTDYGISEGQMRTIITEASLDYKSMTFPTKDFIFLEQLEEYFAEILGAFGLPRDLFPSVKGATNENMEQAIKQAYQNAIQPFADSWCREVEQDPDFASELKDGQHICASYEHLPVMKEDELTNEQADKVKADKLAVLLFNGIISRGAFAEYMEVDYTGKDNSTAVDNLGKIPLALQQVALARERAITAGDTSLANQLGTLMDELTAQMAQMVNP